MLRRACVNLRPMLGALQGCPRRCSFSALPSAQPPGLLCYLVIVSVMPVYRCQLLRPSALWRALPLPFILTSSVPQSLFLPKCLAPLHPLA